MRPNRNSTQRFLPQQNRKEVIVGSPQPNCIGRDNRAHSITTNGNKYCQSLLHLPVVNEWNKGHFIQEQSSESQRIIQDNKMNIQNESLRQENMKVKQQTQILNSQMEELNFKYHHLQEEFKERENRDDELQVFKRSFFDLFISVFKCSQQDVEDLQLENENYRRLIGDADYIKLQNNQQMLSLQTQLDKQNLIQQADQNGLQETLKQFQNQLRVRDDSIRERNQEIARLTNQLISQDDDYSKKLLLLVDFKEKFEIQLCNINEDKGIFYKKLSSLNQEIQLQKDQILLKDQQQLYKF